MTRRVERVLYLGVSDHRESEAAALERSAGKARVDVIRPGDVQPEEDFVESLGLDEERARLAEDLLEDSQADEMVAALMVAYRDAEEGGPPLERVVISGHCGGNGVYNYETYEVLRFEDLVRLAEIFPRAAGQVEDVMIAACNSGWESTLKAYHQAAFPNMKTLWAYIDKSPLGGGASEAHLRVWEHRSRGDDHARLDRRRFAPDVELAREDHIATWNVRSGYRSTRQQPFERVLRDAYGAEARLGARNDEAQLRRIYNALHALVGHREFSTSDAIDDEERQVHRARLAEVKRRLHIHD